MEQEHSILIMDIGTDFLNDAVVAWRNQGFGSTVCDNMRDALLEAQRNPYYLVMLTMRQVNRDEVLAHLPVLRDMTAAPIVVLSTEHDTATRVLTLNNGASEYTLIPCTIEEGVAAGLALIRMYAASCGNEAKEAPLLCDQSLLISVEHRKVFVKGTLIELSYLEYEILKYLMEYQGKPRSHGQIFTNVWGEEYADSSKGVLRAHIRRLRDKLRISPELPEYIVKVQNYGYCFDPRNTI